MQATVQTDLRSLKDVPNLQLSQELLHVCDQRPRPWQVSLCACHTQQAIISKKLRGSEAILLP